MFKRNRKPKKPEFLRDINQVHIGWEPPRYKHSLAGSTRDNVRVDRRNIKRKYKKDVDERKGAAGTAEELYGKGDPKARGTYSDDILIDPVLEFSLKKRTKAIEELKHKKFEPIDQVRRLKYISILEEKLGFPLRLCYVPKDLEYLKKILKPNSKLLRRWEAIKALSEGKG